MYVENKETLLWQLFALLVVGLFLVFMYVFQAEANSYYDMGYYACKNELMSKSMGLFIP